MGGRSSNGNRSGNTNTVEKNSFFSKETLTKDSFTKTSVADVNIYESKIQVVDAAALVRNDEGKAIDAVKSTAPAYTIIEEDGKFKVYRTLYGGRRRWLKTEKTLDKAIKFADKYHKDEIE